LCIGEYLAHLGDIGFLAADDEPAFRPNLCLQLELSGVPDAGVYLLLYLQEERLEAIKVLALLAIGNLLCCLLVKTPPMMTPTFGQGVSSR